MLTNRSLLAMAVVSVVGVWLILGIGQGDGTQISASSLALTDQLGRASPYFMCNADSTTQLTATLILEVSEGSLMPYAGATFTWRTPKGDAAAQIYRPFVYVGSNTFVAECIIDVNLSTFPPRIDPYSVRAVAGAHELSLSFHICGRPQTTDYAEDFSNRTPGSLPADWFIEKEGYGPKAHWVEDLIFEGHDHVLRSASYLDKEAILVRPLNLSSPHLRVDFRMRLWEELPAGDSEATAFAFGLKIGSGAAALFELGSSNLQQVLPFGLLYEQNTWLDVEIFVDLGDTGSVATTYLSDRLAGRKALPAMTEGEVLAAYIRLGGGTHYICQIDDILIEAYDLSQGPTGRPATSSLTVHPSDGQWLDPNGLIAVYDVEVTPCLPSNPYVAVDGVTLELWNSTHRLGVIGRTSWNGTTCPSPCTVIRHRYTKRIQVNLIDNRSRGYREYRGCYSVRAVPDDPELVLLEGSCVFDLDDPMDSYFSTSKAGLPIYPPHFTVGDLNVTINVEFDPSPRYANASQTFVDKSLTIAWLAPGGERILNESTAMRTHASYPSSAHWAFGVLRIYPHTEPGEYSCIVTAKANSGYYVAEEYKFAVCSVGESAIFAIAMVAISCATAFHGNPSPGHARKHSSGIERHRPGYGTS